MSKRIPVIFRRFPQGDVIALYPTQLHAHDMNEILSYQVIGEHGAASRDLIDTLEPV